MKKIIDYCSSLLLRFLLFCHIPNEIAQKTIQFVQFCVVGISNTLISYIIYLIGIWLNIHYILASVIGFIVSVTNSFYWNNKYVFKAKENETRSILGAYIKTFISYGITGLVLANILLVIWFEVFNLPEWCGPILNLVITIPLNFLLNKIWAFKTDKID